jgi:hypothetical protein
MTYITLHWLQHYCKIADVMD